MFNVFHFFPNVYRLLMPQVLLDDVILHVKGQEGVSKVLMGNF